MLKRIFKCEPKLLTFVVIILTCFFLSHKESLGGGTTSTGGGSMPTAYRFIGELDNQHSIISRPNIRLGGAFRDCSPESCPHGSSVPEATLLLR